MKFDPEVVKEVEARRAQMAARQDAGDGERPKLQFLSIDPDCKEVCRFIGSPVHFYCHYEGRYFPCTGEGCTRCEQGSVRKRRFMINVACLDDEGNVVVKVHENSGMVYDQLRALADDIDFETTVVSFKRSGSGTDTRYTIIPLTAAKSPKALLDFDLTTPVPDIAAIVKAKLRRDKEDANNDNTQVAI